MSAIKKKRPALKLQNWIADLSDYDFKKSYISVKFNVVADALSRNHCIENLSEYLNSLHTHTEDEQKFTSTYTVAENGSKHRHYTHFENGSRYWDTENVMTENDSKFGEAPRVIPENGSRASIETGNLILTQHIKNFISEIII